MASPFANSHTHSFCSTFLNHCPAGADLAHAVAEALRRIFAVEPLYVKAIVRSLQLLKGDPTAISSLAANLGVSDHRLLLIMSRIVPIQSWSLDNITTQRAAKLEDVAKVRFTLSLDEVRHTTLNPMLC